MEPDIRLEPDYSKLKQKEIDSIMAKMFRDHNREILKTEPVKKVKNKAN